MNKLFTDNVSEVLKILLSYHGIRYTNHTIKRLKDNPYYPNIFSISKALTELGLDNLAFRSNIEEISKGMEYPFMVSITENQGGFLLIKEITEKSVVIFSGKNTFKEIPKIDFQKSWTGLVLAINSDNKLTQEINFQKNRFNEILKFLKYPITLLTLVVLLSYLVLNKKQFNLQYLGYLITSLCGLFFSSLLIFKTLDRNNSVLNKLCNSKNKKIDCDSILDSKAAYLFGLISWSELGVFYFLLLTFLLVTLTTSSSLLILGTTSFFAIPIMIYSVIYQGFYARKWCKLCLFVQSILLIQVIITLTSGFQYLKGFSAFQTTDYLVLLLDVAIVFVILSQILPLVKKKFEFENKYKKSNKVKMNPDVFSMVMEQNRKISTLDCKTVSYGNEESENKITLVLNPTCSPCIRTHNLLFELIERNNDLYIEEIFLVDKDEDLDGFRVATLMIDLFHKTEVADFLKIMKKYYAKPNTDSWIKQNGLESSHFDSSEHLRNNFEWCIKNNIQNTPTILYNGNEMPVVYGLKDLEYLLK